MIELYSNNGVIKSQQGIITEVNNIEKNIILSQDNPHKSMDRRQFMMFSAVLAGTMIFPTKAEAWIWWLIRPAIMFVIRSRPITSIIRTAGKTAINIGRGYSTASKVKKIKKVKQVKKEFKVKVGLDLNPKGLLKASDIVASQQTKIIWDREGYHQSPKTGEEFKNIAWLRIKNKTNKYIETKIKLALLTGQRQQTFKRKYTLKVTPNADAKIDVSNLYRKLPRNGIQYIIYDLETHRRDIKISSPNKKIYVTNLIT